MYGTGIIGHRVKQRLVDKTVAIPFVSLVQRNGATDEPAQSTRLRQCLSVKLVNPRFRAVGTDDDERQVLIPSLSHGRSQVEQGRATGDTDDDRLMEGLHHADGIETSRAFVGHGITCDVRALVQIVDDGGITAARTDDGMTDTVPYEQGRQYIDVLLIGEHFFAMTI